MARKAAKQAPTVAQAVRHYIDARPVVRDAIGMGIVNYSALTRQILEETGIQGEEAVLVACRRYAPKARKAGYESGIRRLLDKSKLEVRTRMAVLTLHASWRLMSKLEKAVQALRGAHPVHILHGSESITLITDESLVPEMEETFGSDDLIKKRTRLVELNIRSPDSVEDVPGILAFLASSLAGKGINFVEVISCHKDNMFLIDEEDLFEAMQVLNGLIRA